MQPPIPYVRILLVGDENIGKRSLLGSFFFGPRERIGLWTFSRYKGTQLPDKVPDALFDIAESMQPRATGKESSTTPAIEANATDGLTLKEIWDLDRPWYLQHWVPGRSFSLEEACKFVSPHVIGICFSVADHEALDGVKDKWYPVVRYLFPGVPVLIIGTQKDLRQATLASTSSSTQAFRIQNKYPRPSTPQEGENLAKALNALGYIECSARYDKPSVEQTVHTLSWIGTRFAELTTEAKAAQNGKWATGCILC